MERSTIVRVHEGLHARPATRFVKLAKGFESDVELVKDGKAVSAKSSVKLMLLAVKENQEVTVRAKVVKYNGGVMGKNWLHIRDGSGEAGNNDLTVTTATGRVASPRRRSRQC